LGVKTALITGASSGIGAEFARQLAAQNYRLILVARRQDRLQQLADQLRGSAAAAPEIEILQADLATDPGVSQVAQRLHRGDVTLLINNAGFGINGRFADQDLSVWQAMHQVHVMAAMRLTHAAVQAMLQQEKSTGTAGAIIQVASVAAFFPNDPSYSGTKAWMLFFTEGLDGQLKAASSKIRVQALCPGFTVTEFHDVAQMDRSKVARWLWLPVDRVVRESLAALQHDTVVCVPSWRYWFLSKIAWSLPRWMMRPYIAANNRRLGRG
jgi:uncharacterized protein